MLGKKLKTQFPFINEISANSYQLLAKGVHQLSYENKVNIIFKGDNVSGVYLVESGSLRVFNIDPNGKEITLYSILPGESCLLALNCVFSGILYPAWVSVDSPNTKVSVVAADIFKQLYATEKAIHEFVFSVLSARVFDLMDTLEEITSCDLEQRLASFLIRRANSTGVIKISHQEIASHLGTAREVISRLLKHFEKLNLLHTARGSITILSTQGLANHGLSTE